MTTRDGARDNVSRAPGLFYFTTRTTRNGARGLSPKIFFTTFHHTRVRARDDVSQGQDCFFSLQQRRRLSYFWNESLTFIYRTWKYSMTTHTMTTGLETSCQVCFFKLLLSYYTNNFFMNRLCVLNENRRLVRCSNEGMTAQWRWQRADKVHLHVK